MSSARSAPDNQSLSSDQAALIRLATELPQVLRTLTRINTVPLPPERFFAELLELLSTHLQLAAGAVWMLDQPGVFRIFCSRTLELVCSDQLPESIARNQSILKSCLDAPEAGCEPFPSGADPRCNAVLSVPIRRHGHCVTIVQLFGNEQILQTDDESSQTAVRLLQTAIDRFLDHAEQLPAPTPATDLLSEFQTFTQDLHASLDLTRVAGIVADRASAMLQSDRASVLSRSGRSWRVIAVSGQARINRRTSQLQAVEAFATSVLATGRSFQFDADHSLLPSQIRKPFTRYLEQSHARLVHLLPLSRPDSDSTAAAAENAGTTPQFALLLEQFHDSAPAPLSQAASDRFCNQSALALLNARKFTGIPFRSLLTLPGANSHGLSALTRWCLSALLMITLIAGLCLIPMEYQVAAVGRLIPASHRQVFSPAVGSIQVIHINDGDTVRKGDLLLEISDPATDAELMELRSQLTGRNRELLALRTQWHQAQQSAARTELLRLQSRLEQTDISIAALEKQIAHMLEYAAQLQLRAPIDGVVVLARPTHELEGRPITRGEILLEVFDLESDWVLDVTFEERRFGHVGTAVTSSRDGTIPATYRLRSDPSKLYSGELRTVADHTSRLHGSTPVIRALIATDASRPNQHHLGADVDVRIDCGQRSSGYVLFGDTIDFLQRTLWL